MRKEAVKKKLNNKNGFTLAEVLIVLLITIILLSVGLVALVQYSKDMKRTEMDAAAKNIFIAAQNHLTCADAAGLLEQYGKPESLAGCGTLMPQAPGDVPGTIIWPETNKQYYYIEKSEENLSGSILKDMLPFGAIDEELRKEGNYIIEYDLATASVYGVFYAEKDVDFGYGQVLNLDAAGGRADTKEGRDIRKANKDGIIGYYGGAMAMHLPAAESREPEIEVQNGDTLQVLVRDRNYFGQASDDRTLIQSQITLFIRGKESGNTEKFTLNLKDSTSQLTDPVKADSGKELWWDVKAVRPVSGSEEPYLEYTVTLDDITRSGGHFTDICKNLIPGEDIIITAVCESRNTLFTIKEKEAMTNSLFASVNGEELDSLGNRSTEKEAAIGSLRHLENLDPEVSKLPQELKSETGTGGKVIYTPKTLITTARQVKNMDYLDFFSEKSVYSYGQLEGSGTGALTTASYYGIHTPILKEYEGNNLTISNLSISGQNNAGLFSIIDSAMSVKNLTLDNIRVDAGETGGALVAYVNEYDWNPVEFSDILVTGRESKITSAGNAGGLIGSAASPIDVKNCAAASVEIEAKNGFAGGLIGAMASSNQIENCYASGTTSGGKYQAAEGADYNVRGETGAGGLIGSFLGSDSAVKNSYSTCSVYSPQYAGGFLGGQGSGNTFTDCYATGLVGSAAGGYVGAFAGSTGTSVFTDCRFVKDINPAEVKATGLGDGSAIVETAYKDMPRSGGAVLTRAEDTALTGDYPFLAVNKIGLTAADDQSVLGIHLGDWPAEPEAGTDPDPEPEPIPPEEMAGFGICTFAYREKIDGENRWYTQTIDETGDFEVFNNLYRKKPGVYLADDQYDYGILMPVGTGKIDNAFSSGNGRKFFDRKPKFEVVTIGDKKYHYFPISQIPQDAMNPVTGIAEFTGWMVTGGNDTAVFYFNPDFAAAVEVNTPAPLGTKDHPYEVRSPQQKLNMSRLPAYGSCIFEETLEIL